jgi:hypothetical protein
MATNKIMGGRSASVRGAEGPKRSVGKPQGIRLKPVAKTLKRGSASKGSVSMSKSTVTKGGKTRPVNVVKSSVPKRGKKTTTQYMNYITGVTRVKKK